MSKIFWLNTRFFQYSLLFLVFYFFALLQLSFLPHLSIYNVQFDFIFIAVFLLNFFGPSSISNIQKPGDNMGLWAGVVGGLLLDVFSSLPFGIFTFSFLGVGLLIRKTQLLFRKSNIVSFLVVFLLSFLFYKISVTVLTALFVLFFVRKFFFVFPFRSLFFYEFLFNLILTVLGFLVFKLYESKQTNKTF